MARTTKITKRCTRSGFEVTGTPDEIAEFFYRDKSQKDGFSPWSKDAERQYNKAYRASLSEADVPRKKDADAKAEQVYDESMQSLGARSARKAGTTSKREAKGKGTTTRTSRDGTRSKAAKTRTTTRRKARNVKAQA